MLSELYNVIFEIISMPFEVGGLILTRSVSICDGRTTSCSVIISAVIIVLLVLFIIEMLRWKLGTFDPAEDYKLPRSSHVGFFTRVFYSLLGSDPDVVMLCTWRDRAKRAALGWFLIVTTALAFFSALVLSETIAEAEEGLSSGTTLLFAIVFALFIFSFDRVMIMSEYNKYIAYIRIGISVVVAVFVGSSVAVWVFGATIDRYRLEYQTAALGTDPAAMVAALPETQGAQTGPPGGVGAVTGDAEISQIERLLARAEAEANDLRSQLERGREQEADRREQAALVDRTLEDVRNMKCLLENMQAEVERGTSRGFPCAAFRHLVQDDIRQSLSAGVGRNYRLFSDAVVRIYNERKEALPRLLAIKEGFLRMPLSSAVEPNPAEVRNALERIDRLQEDIIAHRVSLQDEVTRIRGDRQEIDARLDVLRAEIKEYRGKIADELEDNREQQEIVTEMFYKDIVARHVTMFRIIGEEPFGRGFLMLVFIVLLLVMDMSVVLAKLVLKTPQYNDLCDKHERSATAIAEEFLRNIKIRRSLDRGNGNGVGAGAGVDLQDDAAAFTAGGEQGAYSTDDR